MSETISREELIHLNSTDLQKVAGEARERRDLGLLEAIADIAITRASKQLPSYNEAAGDPDSPGVPALQREQKAFTQLFTEIDCEILQYQAGNSNETVDNRGNL